MVGGGSTFDENYPGNWLSFGWNSTRGTLFELDDDNRFVLMERFGGSEIERLVLKA